MKRKRSRPPGDDPVEELRECLAIDDDNLDDELMKQPDLVYRVGMGWVGAMSERDGQKDYLARIEAALFNKVKQDATKGDGKPPPQTELTKLVNASPEWVRKREKLIELTTAVNKWAILKDAMAARGYALHKLCDLEMMQHNAIGGQSERR